MMESDLESVLEIERRSFPIPWSRKSFSHEIKNPHSLCMVIRENVALENSSVCAYSCSHVIGDEMTLLRLAVVPEKRRTGFGGRLMDVALDQATVLGATSAFLEVRPSNVQAQSFYHQFGFRVIGTRPNYYPETGENALVMIKSLKEIS
jgi:ribosomal-protein-alanine N-acetyltransferase